MMTNPPFLLLCLCNLFSTQVYKFPTTSPLFPAFPAISPASPTPNPESHSSTPPTQGLYIPYIYLPEYAISQGENICFIAILM